MWDIAICDDNRRECCEMEEILEVYCWERKIAVKLEVFHDGYLLYETMRDGRRYDIIFLDILMQGMDGIRAGWEIRRRLHDEEVQLVYMSCVTGHADLLVQNRPIGFIGKPIRKEEVYRAADDARRLGQQRKKWFQYRWDKMIYQVPYTKILYFQSLGRKVEIHTVDGVCEFYGKLSQIMEEGLPEQFVQIHQSYIINGNYIVSLGRDRLCLQGQKGYFSISHPYRDSVMRQLCRLFP